MRAVLDPNVLVPSLLSRNGTPAAVLRAWLDGAYELVISPGLLDELTKVLAYPKISARVSPTEAQEFLDLLRAQAEQPDDPPGAPPVRSPDPDDDYLIALAASAKAVIVTGDNDLLGLADHIPVHTPAQFHALLAADAPTG